MENAGGGGGGAVSAVANGADNRLVTFSSSDALNGEANLIFDGSQLTVSGEITATTLDIGGIDVTSTAAELNIVDGDTAATSTTLADADRVVVNDGGTMKQVALTDFETYFENALDTLSNVTSVGTLTALQVDNINIDGNTISSTAGTDLNITPLAGQQIVLDGTIVIDAGVVTGATSITSTAFVGDLTGDVTGNADTATALQTARTIAGKSFDGTGNITIATTDLSDITALDTDLSSVSSSDDTLASAKAIKTYVDAQVTAQDLDFQGDSGGALSIDLDSETLDIAGGAGIDTVGSSNTLTVAIDSTVATLAGSQTLTNKTLTSPDINTPDIDGGTIDNCIIGGSTAAAGTFTSITIGSTLVTATAAELNILDGVTSTAAELNILDGVTSTAAELNILDNGRTVTPPPLNYTG